MHSPLPAALPSKPAILIAAISGRALAAAARRAGYRPLVADMFNDTDTLQLAERSIVLPGSLKQGIDGDKLIDSLTALTGNDQPLALIYGSGFERNPDVIDRLAQHFQLAGNSGSTVKAVKDPQNLAALCRKLDIPHPEIRLGSPTEPNGWLAKLSGGAGGSHVRGATGDALQDDEYFQRFMPGKNLSVLFLARAGQARIVGFSRQWAAPAPDAPFRYGGAVRLTRFDASKRHKIHGWLDRLTAATGLLGLCSADMIDGPEGLHLIEINPRPGATLDIFDCDAHPLLGQHLNAVQGAAITSPAYYDTKASAIAYASQPIPRFPAVDWPAETADQQRPGTALGTGDPICTVLARGKSAAAAERAVRHRLRDLTAHWKEESP